MILECTECKARFLVPDRAIGLDGRQVRCGKCSHSWFQPPAPKTTQKSLEDLDKMLDEINANPKPIPKGSNLPKIPVAPASLVQKITTGALAVAALGLLVLATAPSLLGYPRSSGIALADVGIVRVAKDQHTMYKISGKIANMTGESLKVLPTLRITLVDAEGNALQYWDYSNDLTTIEAKKSIPFDTDDLEVRFSKGSRFVVEIGNPLELALRRKPG